MRDDDVTREIKIPTDAELLSEIGGELPDHGHTSYDERCDLDVTQRLQAIEDEPMPGGSNMQRARAMAGANFWESETVNLASSCTCHAPNSDSARAARDAFDAVMGEPLRLWGHMMAELRGGR